MSLASLIPDSHWPTALRDAVMLIGFVCVLIGLLVRGRGGDGKGLGVALVLVGVCMILSGPVGLLLRLW